jgi:hypothetical protein
MIDKCSLCLEAEGKQFPEMRALYCDPCYNAKRDAWGKVDEILPGLFLSGMREAETWTGGTRLCVHEDTPTYEGGIHLPVLSKKPNSFKDRTGAIANLEALYQVGLIIHRHQLQGDPLLVHCWGGVERSPLALAYYLTVFTAKFVDLDHAYAYLKSKRPVVSQRKFWLPE